MRKALLISLILIFTINNNYCQLWKKYTDSAKSLAQANPDRAIAFYYKAKEILPKDSAGTKSYAGICNNLANLYVTKGRYDTAESLYLESKQIREKVLGKESAEYIGSCNNLAFLYKNVGQYKKAELLYIEAKQIREKEFGQESAEYAASCNNLATLYKYLGQYEKAELLYIEAKQIRERVLGKEHPDYAQSCLNLANLYRQTGDYNQGEALYLEAKYIWEKSRGKEHPTYALSCNNLGNLYMDIGDYEKAQKLFLEAKEIRAKVLGKQHPDYAASCNDLAGSYRKLGHYQQAENLYIESREIREKVLGTDNPDFAESCNNLANLYRQTGDYKKAELLYVQASQIWQKAFGEQNAFYALVCSNLARLYEDENEFEKAESLFLKARHIREIVFGKEHPDYALVCGDLANLCWDMKKYDEAHAFFIEAFKTQHVQTNKIFQFTNEAEKQSYLKKNKIFNNNFFSFSTTAYPQQGDAYDVCLSNRNLILLSSQHLHEAIYNTSDTSLRNKYEDWIRLKEQLSYWYTEPASERTSYVTDLEERAKSLEKELVRFSSAFKNQQAGNNIKWQAVQKNLKNNEAAIEVVDFNFYYSNKSTDSTFYIALLLRKDIPQPHLIKLFEKKQLDSLLNNVHNVNTLYSENPLYNLIWKPLDKYLKGISKVYFAPAGELFKISFAALPVNAKDVVSDKYQLIQLSTTASVTEKKESLITALDTIQLYGGIQYSGDTTALKEIAIANHPGNEISRSLPGDLERSDSIQFLTGTQEEVKEIMEQADKVNVTATILSGNNATEASFKALNGVSSPSVLHIATHGFFFRDPKQTDSIQLKFEKSAKVFRQLDNPLFRSGLLFAGANNAWQGKPVSGIEDGIVTAYDVSNMYLPNTKLVVLSACETALGDIQGSEGVYGLQRSFKIAGVQNLVMSLWKVPDAETAEFMQMFYQNMFNKQSVSDAFYHAQTAMKNKYRSEPVKWAAWILVR